MKRGQAETMPNVTKRAMHGLVKTLHAVKLILVAVICLFIGVTARQLFDAYGREVIPFLREKGVEAETYEAVSPQQQIPLPRKSVELFRNR